MRAVVTESWALTSAVGAAGARLQRRIEIAGASGAAQRVRLNGGGGVGGLLRRDGGTN